MSEKKVSKALYNRLPRYLEYLRRPEMAETIYVSATTLANALNLGEVLVRKDLAQVSDGGRPWVGYQRKSLIADIEHFLGFDVDVPAVLIGAGRLGHSLMHNRDLALYGIRIAAVFDKEPYARETETGVPLCAMEDLEDFCRRYRPTVGIIAVPNDQAQAVCDRLVAARIRIIWNYSSVYLTVPENVLVQNENIKASLTHLRLCLREQ